MTALSRFVALCSALGFVLGTGAVARADSTVLAPSACRPAGTIATGLTYGMGHVTNTSGALLGVVCPLVRNTTFNSTGLRDLEIAITDSTGTASCDVAAVDRAGNLLQIITRVTPGTGHRIIDFGWALTTSVDRGHFQVICRLPPNARIHSIYYDEI